MIQTRDVAASFAKKFRRLFAILSFAIAAVNAAPAAAQTQTASASANFVIEGTVLTPSGHPLPYVSVYVPAIKRGAFSDQRGHFRIMGVPAGDHLVIAERIGHKTAQRTVSVGNGMAVRVDFSLAEQALLMENVVVSASREAVKKTETAAAVSSVSSGVIAETKASHPSEIMGKMAGVYVSVTGGEGHQTAIRQPKTTNPVYLFLEDGVPTRSTGFFNHNALYEVNLPAAERVEVIKGPATALYGSDAIGGIVNVGTKAPSPRNAIDASIETGEFGYRRLLLSGSDTWGKQGFRADLNLSRTGGWRDATAYDRQSGTIRWDIDLGPGSHVKTVATYSRIDQQTAGGSAIGLEDFLNAPTINYTPVSFRNVRAFRLSTEFEKMYSKSLLTITPFARWNEMELLPNWTLSFDPTVYTTGHTSAGLLARFRRDFEPMRARLIGGLDVDFSPGSRIETRGTVTRSGKVFTSFAEGEVVYDYDVTFRGVSPYMQAEISPIDAMRITAGLRYDNLGYEYDNKLSDIQTGRWRRPADTEVSYSHWSPKLGATYTVAPALNLFASYSHGFRAPSESQLFRQGQAVNTVGLLPVKVNSYDVGVRGQIGSWFTYDLAAYSMIKMDDIVALTQPDGNRLSVNAGETSHRGVELGLGVALRSDLRLDVSYSLAEHVYEKWTPSATLDLSGKFIEFAPEDFGNVQLTYRPRLLKGGNVSAELTRVGRYQMDPENARTYEGHNLINLRASHQVHQHVMVFARLMNVTDKRYAEDANYTAARGAEFSPGLPRTYYLGLSVR